MGQYRSMDGVLVRRESTPEFNTASVPHECELVSKLSLYHASGFAKRGKRGYFDKVKL
jgi:hypothetical protein